MTRTAPIEVECDFEPEVRRVLGVLKAAFSGLLTEASNGYGDGIRTALDLQNALGLRSTLAWQVLRFTRCNDPLDEVETIPGQSALGLLIDAVRNKKIAEGRLAELVAAIEAYEKLVRRHAGSRKAFNAMVAGVGNGSTEGRVDQQQLREAFHINSRIWGIRLGCRLSCYVIHPKNDTHVDIASIYGVVDLLRLHGRSPYLLSQSRNQRSQESTEATMFGHPLSRSLADESGPSLLDAFCSEPRPIVRHYVDARNHLVTELIPPKIGRQGAITAHVAEVFRNASSRHAMEDPDKLGLAGFVQTPAKVMVSDILIAEGTYGTSLPHPQAHVLRSFTGVAPSQNADLTNDRLDRPEVVHLGQGASILETPDVPRYPEMFRYVCKELGWDPNVFHVFRCRVEYPVMPSLLYISFDKPEKPK